MTRDDVAVLEDVLRRSRLAENVGKYVRGRLDLDTWYDELLSRYAFEKSAYDLHGNGPADAAEYRRHIAPILDGLRRIHRRVDGWLEERLQAAKWIGFGVKVPMEADPAHTPLSPAQWLLLRVNHIGGFAEGGGHRYEVLRVFDLARLSAEEANRVRLALECLAAARRANAERAGISSKGTLDSAVIGRELAAAFNHAVDRTVSIATDPSAPVPVVIAGVSPDALMRVQVAAMEIPQRPQPDEPATSRKQGPPEDRPKRPPGRPSLMSRLIEQTELRARQGRQADTLAEESRQLHDWVLKNRQDGDPPVPLPDAIQNGIRDHYWSARQSCNGIKELMPDNN